MAMVNQLVNRTVTPDGPTIQRLRIKKGWRVEDLAKKASCSVKTVKNFESGENVYLFTLKKFADALGVEVPVLIKPETPPEPLKEATAELPRKERRFRMQITVDFPFEEFDESVQLSGFMTMLKQIINAKDEMVVIGVAEGSTVITLEMSEYDIERLVFAFGPQLDSLRIEKLQMPDDDDFTLREKGMISHSFSIDGGELLRGKLLTRVLLQRLPKMPDLRRVDVPRPKPRVPESKPVDNDPDET